MAVQVLDYQGYSSMQRGSADGCEVSSASLQNMQHLMNLLSQKQMPQAKDAYSHIADASTSDLKRVITLLGGLGHARFRRAPGGSPATSSSPLLFHISSAGGSPATPPSPPLFHITSSCPSSREDGQQHDTMVRSSPCQDATQPTCVPDMYVPQAQLNFTYCPGDNESNADKDAHNANGHVSSHILDENLHAKHVSGLHSSCNSRKKELNADGSVYNSSTPHALHVHGHARCREATSQKLDHHSSTRKPLSAKPCVELDQAPFAPLKTNSSFVSSVSMEERGGTVSSGKPLYSSARPPLPPKKRKSPEKVDETSRKCHSSAQCHCAHKRRKLKSRTVVKVPATNIMSLDNPDDGYSWCVYGQKSVEGSPYPRVYYKCSSVRGCPARKHAQRASEDSNMLIVTYGRKHMHPQIGKVPMSGEDNLLS